MAEDIRLAKGEDVDSLNESVKTLNNTIGNISEIKTTDVSNIVNAINELVTRIETIEAIM